MNQLGIDTENGVRQELLSIDVTENTPELLSVKSDAIESESKDENATPPTHNYSTRSKERQIEKDLEIKSKLKQLQHNVVVQPRLKPVPFLRSDLNTVEFSKNLMTTTKDIKFYQSEDRPFNRRGFKYKPCRPNPSFKSNLYSTSEIPPFKVRPSYFDMAQGIVYNSDISLISTLQGWRSVRSNICIREGNYYFEFNIVNANEEESKSHVRIGLARKEASLEAPVGFDGYSYGLRDVQGEFMTLSRPKEVYVEGGFNTGDVIGFLVQFPPLKEHRKAVDDFIHSKLPLVKPDDSSKSTPVKQPDLKRRKKTRKEDAAEDNVKFSADGNIVRDQVPIRYKNALYYEQYEYSNTKIMDHLLNPVSIYGEKAILEKDSADKQIENLPIIPNSKIRIFKNGVEQKGQINDLYSFLPTNVENEELNISPNTRQQQNPSYKNTDDSSLGYYPMLSVFQNGIVGLNAGPDFKFPIDEQDVKPLSQRYEESIVDEWYWDIIDEVEAEYLDSFDA
ncbi:putative subunit of the compass histone methyltransferase complex [Scheffersomyces coipomensis]|uniref:putative subunit of the compass histone methyltransferase complex n=1 Tax=Scheffersomyces coipomensis TaxID=1788519 RepID=UPI00315DE50E